MLRRRLLLDSTMMASWRLKFANRTGQLSLAKRVPGAVGKTAAAERRRSKAYVDVVIAASYATFFQSDAFQ